MKKFIYAAFAVLAMSFSFAACGGDDDEIINYDTTAEKATQGVYSGTWTRTKTSDGSQELFEGTVTLTATSTVGCTDVTFDCAEASLNSTSIANVWNAGHGFQFLNQVANPPFAGSISETGVLTLAFTLEQRVGRTLTKYDFYFEGNKQ